MDANNVHPVGRVAHIRVLTTKTGFSTCTRIVTATVKRENKFRPFCRIVSGVSIRVPGPLRPVGEDQCEPRKNSGFRAWGANGKGRMGAPVFEGLTRHLHGSRGPLRFPLFAIFFIKIPPPFCISHFFVVPLHPI